MQSFPCNIFMKARGGVGSVAVLILNLCIGWGGGVQCHAAAALPPRNSPV
jgi:hypothetical protein